LTLNVVRIMGEEGLDVECYTQHARNMPPEHFLYCKSLF
jgi:hypothetical protein